MYAIFVYFNGHKFLAGIVKVTYPKFLLIGDALVLDAVDLQHGGGINFFFFTPACSTRLGCTSSLKTKML